MTTASIAIVAATCCALITLHSDGGLNMPSEDTIDAMPGLEATIETENYRKRHPLTPDLFSDAEIDEADKRYTPDTTAPSTGLLGYLAGGYNMPTDADINACATHRAKHYRGACLAALQRAHGAFLDSKIDGFILRDDGVVDLDIFNPMPEAESAAEEAMQAWAVRYWLTREDHVSTLVKLRGEFIVNPVMTKIG